ncbi:hypothetical protein SDC9_66095 [bioreactor metagenome]|uniref:Uncharacterized protein n=1 Tax=bioreactor metagenome TaxID=1076179 RepID=A0A644XUA8_9ZZZZ
MHSQKLQPSAHHQRVGLAHIVRLLSRGQLDGSQQRPAGRGNPGLRGAGQVVIGGDQLCACVHQPDGFCNHGKAISRRFPHHDVIRVHVVN